MPCSSMNQACSIAWLNEKTVQNAEAQLQEPCVSLHAVRFLSFPREGNIYATVQFAWAALQSSLFS